MPTLLAVLWVAGYALRMLIAVLTTCALVVCRPFIGRRRADDVQLFVVRRLGLLRG